MNIQDILLLEYTEIMLGNKRHFSEDFFSAKSGRSKVGEERAVQFIRLVSKIFLQVDNLGQARGVFTKEMVSRMRLSNIFDQIYVPDYVDSNDRIDYVAAKIFSKKFDPEKWTAEHYCMRILNKSLTKFPRNYMDGELGLNRACYCLRYFLQLERPGSSALDLLNYASTSEFRIWLQDHLLSNVCTRYYDTRVDFMYDALPDDMKINILFMIYKTKALMERAPSVITA